MKKKMFNGIAVGLLLGAGADAAEIIRPAAADTYLYKKAETLSYGARDIVAVRNDDPNTQHGLLRFDLSGLETNIIISSVTLRMQKTAMYSGAKVDLHVYELSAANTHWVEGSQVAGVEAGAASWAQKAYNQAGWAGSTGASTAGTDYLTDVLATDRDFTLGVKDFVSTAAFVAAVSNHLGGELNLLLMLNPDSTSTGKPFVYASKENTVGQVVPTLIIQTAGEGGGTVSAMSQEPSNEKQLDRKTESAAYDEEADRKRLEQMTPAELAWERKLERHLGSFYLPLYKKAKAEGKVTAWDFVQDDPSLPRVMIIGDSISRGYTLPVRHALAGKVNVHRAPANCSSTEYGLKNLDEWLGEESWDLIVFNFGIHDGRLDRNNYAPNLKKIVSRLQAVALRLVFATTTPVLDGSLPYPVDSVWMNQTAMDVMKENGVSICDLYSAVLPDLSVYQLPANVHFKNEGYGFLGKQIADAIQQNLQH